MKIKVDDNKTEYKLVRVDNESHSQAFEIDESGKNKSKEPLTEWGSDPYDDYYYAIYYRLGDRDFWEEYLDFDDDLAEAVKEYKELIEKGEKIYVGFE